MKKEINKMLLNDTWDLRDNDKNSKNFQKVFHFHFDYIEDPDIKNLIKLYIWRNYREKTSTLNTIHKKSMCFKYVVAFMKKANIKDFKSITNNEVSKFLSFLKTAKNSSNGKMLSQNYQKQTFHAFKSLIDWGMIYQPEYFPQKTIFMGNEFVGIGRDLSIDFIPDDVMIQINKALSYEQDPYVKHSIIILKSTGMRVSELLSLTTESLQPHLVSGYTLKWYDYKKRKQKGPIPVNGMCANSIKSLIEYTEELRKEVSPDVKNRIFLYRPTQGPSKGKAVLFTDEQLRLKICGSKSSHNEGIWGFTARHNIRASDGKIFVLKTHQFRRTLATDMHSKGMDIKLIQEVLGHSSPSTTAKYYADVKDSDRASVFKEIGIIGNIEDVDSSIISNQSELEWFKANQKTKARMVDGYCLKPCQGDDICSRLLGRNRCYRCNKYITTPEYLEVHKSYLAELEAQLEENVFGDHYAKHLLPTIEILREIVARLEELKK